MHATGSSRSIARRLRWGFDYIEVVERHSFDPRIWPVLRRLVRDRRIDIVHAHDHKTDALTWVLATREAVVPLSTAHGFAGEHWNERMYYTIEKRLLARFPRVIAVSEPIKRELVRTGSKPERVTVINNAIDHRVFRRDPALRDDTRRALGFDSEDTVIGAVGRLEAEKRFDLLLEAFSNLHERHPRAILVIVGEGSLRTDLEAEITRLNLRGSVRLLGYRTDIVQLHNAFDVFVQSSEREGTPNSVLEAMAMETPLVATEVGGTGELVTNGVHGLLVPRHDVSAMTKALEAVLSDRAGAASRAAAARARVEVDLSFERRVQRVEAIYDELLEHHSYREDS